MRTMRLGGDRNVCPSCSQLFRSAKAFDKHRTGSYGVSKPDGTYLAASRRCKTLTEMTDDGMLKNARGLWITKAFRNAAPFDAGPALAGK